MRYLRYGLAVLLFIAILVLLAIAALYGYVTPERAQKHAQAAIEEAFGIRLDTAEPATLKRLPKLVLAMENVSLSSPSGERLGSVRRIVLTMNPFALFAETPRLEAISLEGPAVSLTPESAASLHLAERAAAAGWQVDLIDVVGGALSFSNADGTASLSAASARFEGLTEAGALIRMAGTMKLSSFRPFPDISGEASFASRVDWSEGIFRLTQASASLKGLSQGSALEASASTPNAESTPAGWNIADLQINAKLNGGHLSASAGKISWDGRTVLAPRFAACIDASVAKNAPSLRLEGQAAYVPSSGAFSLAELDASLMGPGTDGQASKQTAKLSGEISWLQKDAALPDQAASGRIRLAGDIVGAPVDFSASLKKGRIGQPQLDGLLQLGSASLHELVPFATAIWHSGWQQAADGRIELKAAELKPGFSNARALLLIEDGALRLENINAECLTGRLEGKAELQAAGAWRAEGSLQDARAEALFREMGKPTAITGSLSARVQAVGNIEALDSLRGHVNISNGALAGIDVAAARQILMEERSPNLPPEVLKAQASTNFSMLEFSLGLSQQGAPQITGGHAEGQNWTADFSGDWQEKRVGNPQAILRSAWLFRLAPLERVPEMPVSAALEVSEELLPAWTLDWDAAAKAVEATSAAEGFSPSDIWKRMRRSLRDFWEGLDLTLPNFSAPDFLKNWKAPWSSEKDSQPKMPEPASSPI